MRMAEVTAHSTVLTLGRDFRVHRKHGRQVIPLSRPGNAHMTLASGTRAGPCDILGVS